MVIQNVFILIIIYLEVLKLENLSNGSKYYKLVINKVIFEFVQVFVAEDKIEIIDKISGRNVASILKDDINSIEKNELR